MTTDTERERFEAWARAHGYSTHTINQQAGAQYSSPSTCRVWKAWLARAQVDEPVTEEFTLEQMRSAINEAQLLLRDMDAGLRRARAEQWDHRDPHEMNVAGQHVRDEKRIEVNILLSKVYKKLASWNRRAGDGE